MNYDSNYQMTHKWLVYHHGKANHCERCGSKDKDRKYEYALEKGKKYEKRLGNFIQMCKPCHVVYDGVIEKLTANKYKPVYGEKDGMKYYFPSIQIACGELGILKTSISNALKGRSLSAGGYKWSYA